MPTPRQIVAPSDLEIADLAGIPADTDGLVLLRIDDEEEQAGLVLPRVRCFAWALARRPNGSLSHADPFACSTFDLPAGHHASGRALFRLHLDAQGKADLDQEWPDVEALTVIRLSI